MRTIDIRECTDPAELYRQYAGQHEPQPVYIELHLPSGILSAGYSAETANGVPGEVYHGFTRRYAIPVVSAAAANRAMRAIAPLAARMAADWESEWDGRNHRAVLGADARAAEAAIEAHLGDGDPGRYPYAGCFSEADLVVAWDCGDLSAGDLIAQYGITARTTDAELERIEAAVLKGLASCADGVSLCPGLDEHLRQVRQGLREDD